MTLTFLDAGLILLLMTLFHRMCIYASIPDGLETPSYVSEQGKRVSVGNE